MFKIGQKWPKMAQKKDFLVRNPHFNQMVPKVGIEPTRYRYRWILSPVRLPISPLGQRIYYIIKI